MTRWLLSTIGKRGYIAAYLREDAAKRGAEIWIAGSGTEEFTPGFAQCDRAYLVPPYDSPEYGEYMVKLAVEQGIDAMLTLADPDVMSLAKIRDELTDAGVQCFFPGVAATSIGFDKLRTADEATRLGIPTPLTALAGAHTHLDLPRVWKPRFGSASSGVAFVDSSEDEAGLPLTDMIVQERIAGEELNVEVLCDLNGQVVRTSVWRKLRSKQGETEIAVTTSNPELVELSAYFAENADFIGPVDFDWIIGPAGPVLIEANTRFGGGYPVSHLAGAGFTDALVTLALGGRLEREHRAVADVFMMKQLVPFGGPITERHELLSLPKTTSGTT